MLPCPTRLPLGMLLISPAQEFRRSLLRGTKSISSRRRPLCAGSAQVLRNLSALLKQAANWQALPAPFSHLAGLMRSALSLPRSPEPFALSAPCRPPQGRLAQSPASQLHLAAWSRRLSRSALSLGLCRSKARSSPMWCHFRQQSPGLCRQSVISPAFVALWRAFQGPLGPSGISSSAVRRRAQSRAFAESSCQSDK